MAVSCLPPYLESSRPAHCPSGALLSGGFPPPGSSCRWLGVRDGRGPARQRRGVAGEQPGGTLVLPGVGRSAPRRARQDSPSPSAPGSRSRPAGWRGPLCGCRTETSGCPSAFSSESRAAGLSCVFMLEVGPKGVESALLTHTTVCGLWEFITGEVFHEQKGCFSSKTWWVCFCKYVDAASLVNNLATLLPTRRL